jgi:hypothetical protein
MKAPEPAKQVVS